MSQQGILVSVETVLRDLQVHRRSIEGNARATRLDEIRNSIKGATIVVDHYPTRIHPRTYSIIKHQRQSGIHQTLKMVVLMRILGLRHDDATHLVLEERLTDAHLTLILLIALSHHDAIATGQRLLLDA